MKINEVCKLTGLTKKAIDYYEKKKIISPEVMENGYRKFSKREIDKLKKIALFRSLGLGVKDIKNILDSKFSKEELRKCVIKKKLENEISNIQAQLLKELSLGKNIGSINKKIEELNKKKSIKENILETFPGFYGRFLVNHFSRFLEESIKTEEQKRAYKEIINFLDKVEPPQISDEIIDEFDQAMNFWTDERLEKFEEEKQKNIENPKKFLKEQSKTIEEYQRFKESEEYKASSIWKIMEAMKKFGETSGYNEVFIPAMRKLSPSYEEYYQNLLKANEIFVNKHPKFK